MPIRGDFAASLAALTVLAALAGCADDVPAVPQTDERFAGVEVGATATTGVLRGIVLDEPIRPIADARVTVRGPEQRAGATDADGRFAFGEMTPGLYAINVSRLNYLDIQMTGEVHAGEAEPTPVQVILPRRFSQDPFVRATKFDGYIQCGYDVNFASSLCANDYTRFVPIIGDDPLCPECEHLLGDNRGYDSVLEPAWQTLVFEMTWDPSAQGTSERMRAIISHTPRPATHWYAANASEDPVQVRIEVGEEHFDRQDEPTMIPPEGMDNLHMFAAVDTNPGQPAALIVSQDFEVFQFAFHYGKPPLAWSFLAGDELPF